jgi:uncharacterized damage-inducible protein DinB
MASLAHHFLTMACNNAWSNHRLLKACAQLSPAEFAARRTSFFPSIKATYNHIVTVDWLYIDMLERAVQGRPPNMETGKFFEPEEPFDTCALLAEAQQAADRRLIALCAGQAGAPAASHPPPAGARNRLGVAQQLLSDAQLDGPVQVPRRDGIYTDRVARILAHLFQHQIHHRGQVHAMLAGTAVKPPQLDEFFCSNEAPLRAQDFAELGFTEEAIWGTA